MELLITSKTNQQFVFVEHNVYVVAKLLMSFFACFEFSTWVLTFRVDLCSRAFIFAIFYNRQKREIKYQSGSIIVLLRRGQDVEFIMRRPKLRFGWTLSST